MKSPILFLIFNRPDTTKQVFEEIRKAQPPRLYIAADGPRPSREGEKELCEQTRAIASDIDWECEVKTLFRNENLGCGKAVSQAITWFFDKEPEGIILEDDVLPHPDFFPYCDEMLERYRDDNRIGLIAGHNHIYQALQRKSSYGFLSVPHIWGWATWRNNWALYDYNLTRTSEQDFITALKTYGYNSTEIRFWKTIYNLLKHHRYDTWDYQWAITLMSHGRLNPTPYNSLTKNIGFGSNATHTPKSCKEEIELITKPIYPLVHPENVLIDREADNIETINEHRYQTRINLLKVAITNTLKKVFVH